MLFLLHNFYKNTCHKCCVSSPDGICRIQRDADSGTGLKSKGRLQVKMAQNTTLINYLCQETIYINRIDFIKLCMQCTKLVSDKVLTSWKVYSFLRVSCINFLSSLHHCAYSLPLFKTMASDSFRFIAI